MNPEPHCQVKVDAKTGKIVGFSFVCSDDPDEHARVAAKRVEQITKQLECPHGLTNKERPRLHRERAALHRAFLEKTAVDKAKEEKKQKKFEAAEKELEMRWRKAVRERGNWRHHDERMTGAVSRPTTATVGRARACTTQSIARDKSCGRTGLASMERVAKTNKSC
jgi:hypothetical protein